MKLNKLWIFVLLTLLVSSLAFASTPPDASATELYYSFDNTNLSASNPLDLTPNNNDGTNNGATTGVTGIINESFEFDGTNDYVDTGSNLGLSDPQSFSVNAWINLDAVNRQNYIWFQDNTAGRIFGVLRVNSNNKFEIASFGISSLKSNIVTSSISATTNTDYMVTGVWDATLSKYSLYVDGVFIGTSSSADALGTPSGNSFIGTGGGFYFDGKIDEFAVFTESLTQSQIEYLYASGAPTEAQQYPFASANFTITAKDSFYNTSINTFNATINGTLYNSINSSIVTPYLLNETDILNISIEAESYFPYENQTYNTSNGNLQAELDPSLFSVEVQALDILNNSIQIQNFTIENRGVNFTTTNGTAYPEFETSTENITIYADGYFTKTIINKSVGFDFNVTLLANEYRNNTELFYINDSLRNTQVTEYIANITAIDNDYQLMNLTIIADGFFSTPFTNRNITGDRNFTINPDNAFYLTVRDQKDSAIINQDISVNVQQGIEETVYNITNGQGIIENISANTLYTLVLSTTGYETRSVTYEHDNTNPLSNLTALLINSSEVGYKDVVFNIVDSSNLPAEDVLVTARALVNGTYQVVQSGETDITGRQTFFLDENIRHQITLEKSGFTTEEFFINAPLDNIYTFRISTLGDFDQDNALFNIIYKINPKPVAITNTTYEFNFSVTALDNDLEYFNVNVITRNISTGATVNKAFNSSSDSSGGLLSVDVDFSGDLGKLAIFNYCLKKIDQQEVCFYSNIIIEKDYSDERNFGSLRQYIANNLTTGEKVFFFSVFLLITIIISVAIPFTRNIFSILPIGLAAVFYAWLFLPQNMLIVVGLMTTILVILLLSRIET